MTGNSTVVEDEFCRPTF